MVDDIEVMSDMINKIKQTEREIETIKSFEYATVTIKTTAGDPATGYTGQIVVNTSSNTIKMWAEGAWRTMATW